MVRGGASPDGAPTAPESLPEWLSQRYVSNSHLQAALSSLELDILRNISLLVGRGHGGDSGTEDAPHGAAPHGAAVTREVRGGGEEGRRPAAGLAPQRDLSLISCCSSRTSM